MQATQLSLCFEGAWSWGKGHRGADFLKIFMIR